MNLIAKNSIEYTRSDPERYFEKVQDLLNSVQDDNFCPKAEFVKDSHDFSPVFLLGFQDLEQPF